MKIQIEKIRRCCERILIDRGMSKKDVTIIVDGYLEGELLGKYSHGLVAFLAGYKYDAPLKRRKIIVKKDRGPFAYINGNKQSGLLVAEKARELAIRKARKYGVSVIGIHNSYSLLRPGSAAEKIARHGFLSVIFWNGGGALVAPHGGIDPVLSTSPIGYGIPTNGDPIVVDMATSERAWGEVRMAKKFGHPLPPNAYINRKGRVTIDPDDVFAALPFGGYKGYAVGILVEVFSGALVGEGVRASKGWLEDRPGVQELRGGFFLTIDPKIFVGAAEFRRRTSTLVLLLKKSRKRPGFKEILVPGDRAYAQKRLTLQRGWIEVNAEVWKKILEICVKGKMKSD